MTERHNIRLDPVRLAKEFDRCIAEKDSKLLDTSILRSADDVRFLRNRVEAAFQLGAEAAAEQLLVDLYDDRALCRRIKFAASDIQRTLQECDSLVALANAIEPKTD